MCCRGRGPPVENRASPRSGGTILGRSRTIPRRGRTIPSRGRIIQVDFKSLRPSLLPHSAAVVAVVPTQRITRAATEYSAESNQFPQLFRYFIPIRSEAKLKPVRDSVAVFEANQSPRTTGASRTQTATPPIQSNREIQ